MRRLPIVSIALVTVALALLATPAFAQLQKIETGDLRLVFLSPSETYLVCWPLPLVFLSVASLR